MNGKQKILAVDDEPRNLKIMLLGLRGEWEITTAASGEECMDILRTSTPDIILLDIMMPGIDGYEICRQVRLRQEFEFTKIILVSGRALLEERLKGYEVGADDYMTKPFVPEELAAKVKVFMRLVLVEKELKEFNVALEERVNLRNQQLLAAEAKLVNAAKMSALGEMAGGIAHEINTPLGVITLVSSQLQELVQEESLDRVMILKLLGNIEKTTQKIGEIVRGLRLFSRESSKDGFEAKPLREIIESTLSLCREKFKNLEVNLVREPFDDDLLIECRAPQISQVILNLLTNACDAVEESNEKWVKLNCQTDDKVVKIRVTDSGSGIPKETLDKLFQPFFTTKGIGKGTGLGLSISKGLVESHHGTLFVDSNSTNTCFVIELPLKQAGGV